MSLYSDIKSNIKYLIPLFMSLLLSIISIMPIMPNGYDSIAPLLGVVSMTFWIVHRPDIMGWLFVVIIGIFSDIIYGSVLGSALLSSLLIRVVLTKMLHKLDPVNIFHSLFYITISLLIWLIISLVINSAFNLHQINYYNYLFQCLISIIISPIVIFFQLYLLKKITS
jgi:rod shape-determining protein MreD